MEHSTKPKEAGKTAFVWLKMEEKMPKVRMNFYGFLLGIVILKLTLLQFWGNYLLGLPVLFISPIRYFYPDLGLGFLITYCCGLFIGKFALNYYPSSWVWPEIIVIFILFLLTGHLTARYQKRELEITGTLKIIKKEYEGLSARTKELKKENLLIERKLRDVESLYDLIKEAGSTLNVQEMIELAKEFIGRIFDLPHFLIAVISEDNKKYEIRSVW